MAYTAYREFFSANRLCEQPQKRALPRPLMVLDVTVPSCEAFQVRRLVATCPDTGVVRCVPRPRDHLVRLEIQLPEDKVPEVMRLLMARIPSGEMGALTTWKQHMNEHGFTHGF